MRNFEERKEEIFRRSERIKKESRKRNVRMVSSGSLVAVLALCAMVANVVIKEPKDEKLEAPKDAAQNVLEDNEENKGNQATNSMIVSSNDFTIYQTSYEEAEVIKVQEVLRDVVYKEELTDGDDNYAGTQGNTVFYSIYITGEDGKQDRYLLSENRLVNTETKEESILNEEQMKTILEILQIEEDKGGE